MARITSLAMYKFYYISCYVDCKFTLGVMKNIIKIKFNFSKE